MALIEACLGIVEGSSSIWGLLIEVMIFLVPVWIAFLVGITVGWGWKPRFGGTFFNKGKGKFEFSAPSSPTAPIQNKNSLQVQTQSSRILDNKSTDTKQKSVVSSLSKEVVESGVGVREEDLKHLYYLVERRDGGPTWKHMMDRSAPNMKYQAWIRDVENGPPEYCSRTVYEDATPEMMRDFFWDDEFRMEWDDMLLHSSTLSQCPSTGTMLVHWIRKFPFFCSDREYTIGRRIWDSDSSYYCVTKGVPCPSVPRRDKPRRVDLYYSSWFIQAVESKEGHSACEVILFHHEDMGIPKEIAKFGIRQGMWGAVKNIERGFRAYQKRRASPGVQISKSAYMAQINTKINPEYLKSLGDAIEDSPPEPKIMDLSEKPKEGGVNIPKLVVFGGAVALVCSLDRGLLTKAVILGIARKFGNIGKRMR